MQEPGSATGSRAGGIIGPGCRRQGGSGLTEAVASMLVFLPLFIVIPLVGKQLSMKHETIEATRYVTWERTVWSGGGADHAGGTAKWNRLLALEARDRVAGDPDAPIRPPQALASNGVSTNPLWVDRRGDRLLARQPGGAGAESARTAGLGNVGEEVGLTGMAESIADRSFDLDTGGYVRGVYRQTQRPVIADWGRLRLSGRQPGPNDGRLDGRNDLRRQASTGALLTPAHQWDAHNESIYHGRVDEAVADEPLARIELGLGGLGPSFCSIPASGCSGGAFIGEVGYGDRTVRGDDVEVIPGTGAVPDRYLRD